jgi:NADH-quinone oxidoreductase subunit N
MILPIFLEVAAVALGIFILLYEAFAQENDKRLLAVMGMSGLGVVFILSFFVAGDPGTAPYWSFYKIDATAMLFKRFALLTTIVVLIMASEYQDVIARYLAGKTSPAGIGEFYSLPLFTCAGLMWMASAADFVMIFVSLELVTVSFYVLVSYMRRNAASLEAGVKYLILGALSTGFLVYGITWIFGVTGQTNLDRVSASIATLEGAQAPLLFGIMLILVGLGFKIAAAPFQMWVPDVYQGAPTPITAFLSVGSKAAGFIVLVRVLEALLVAPHVEHKILPVLVIIAAATLIYGNLAAMPQSNLKRLLAYSSIAHAGYLLIALASFGASGWQFAVSFYIASYLLMTLLSFLVMVVVATHASGDDIADFNGLGKRCPVLAFGMLVAMLSLAGIPFTAGFFGKFLVFRSAILEGRYALAVIGCITVAAGFYYYLKVVRAMYWSPSADGTPIRVSALTRSTILTLVALIFLLGVYPQALFGMLRLARPVKAVQISAR